MNSPPSNREHKGVSGSEKESDPDRLGIDTQAAGLEQSPQNPRTRKTRDIPTTGQDQVVDPIDAGTHGSPGAGQDRSSGNGSHDTASHVGAPAVHRAGREPVPAISSYGSPNAAGDTSDEQLLDAYRRGDTHGFTKLVERYQRELFHFLVRFLGDRAAAEDVFQETFLQVHQSAETFDPQRRFRPWLFTIAANKARDLMRSQARRPTNPLFASISPGDEDSGQFIDLMESATNLPSASMEQSELQTLVRGTVMGMPDNLREILLLSYFHQFPYKQISDILNIPLGTVKSRLHAAVASFAERWRQNGENKSASH